MELRGAGVSSGIAVGEALLVVRESVPVFRLLLPPEQVEGEVQRLARAVETSREQLQGIKGRLSRGVGRPHAYIFDAQLLMLDDPLLVDRSVAVIREEHVSAAWALRSVADQLHALFDEFGDAYLRERRSDLDDVLGRIQMNLAGAPDAPTLARLPRAQVLVADEIPPSEAADLDWERVLAVVTETGSATSHTAILARSLGIPAVVGVQGATRRIPAGALVVVDGGRGIVEVEPSQPALAGYRVEQEQAQAEDERLQGTRAVPAVTSDGVTVSLQANAEFPDEAATALLYGASGIGLFRSEYLLGRSREWPSEERQVEIYRALLEAVHPHPVTVRTWDVGRDDLAPGGPSSLNPALGERALRLVARDPGPFRTQLRALLRAGLGKPLRVMFPFIAGPSDLQIGLRLLAEARASLRSEGVAFAERIPIGLNLELPSAAFTADLLAPAVDFFSIGTNDLIQYLLAVDRLDPRVAPLYQPLHPAVLRAIRRIVEAAEAAKRPVAVCGEMASEPLTAVVLLGLGVRELSMSPSAIPRVKAALRGVSLECARRLATECLGMASAGEIEDHLKQALGELLLSARAVPTR